MGRTGTQSNVAPQIQGQKIATQNDILPRKEVQLSAITTVFYRQSQQSVQKADFSTRLYSGINNGQNGQIGQYATVAPDQICPQDKKSIDKRRKNHRSTSEVPQDSNTFPNVGKVFDSNQQSSSKHHVTAGDDFQNSPTKQPVNIANQNIYFLFYFFIFELISIRRNYRIE